MTNAVHAPGAVPESLRTARLLLRAWTPEDADALGGILAADGGRLTAWLPAHVATAAPPEQLRERLAGYAADFVARRTFRYAVFALNGGEGKSAAALVGGADLHPRSRIGRVPLADATCIELGYWLAQSAERHGYALEATRALLEVAMSLSGISHAEARIDPRNSRSANVARRLGFEYATHEAGLDVWQSPVTARRGTK